MAVVLAIEPDPRQAMILRRLVREQVGAEFVLADSRDAALAAIDAHVPDLLLVTTLLSPRDETDITEHLKMLAGAAYLQTLTIPLLAAPAAPKEKVRARMLGAFKRHRPNAIAGCEPSVFGEEIATYLQRALELKAEDSRRNEAVIETPAGVGACAAAATDDIVEDRPSDGEIYPAEIAVPDARFDMMEAAEWTAAPVDVGTKPVAQAEALDPAASREHAAEAALEPAPMAAQDGGANSVEPPPAADESVTSGASERREADLRPSTTLRAPRATVDGRTFAPLDLALRFLRRRSALRIATPLLLPAHSVVEPRESETLAVTPAGGAVPIPLPVAPQPSPWNGLFRALEEHFAREEGKWTDLTSLLSSLDRRRGPAPTPKSQCVVPSEEGVAPIGPGGPAPGAGVQAHTADTYEAPPIGTGQAIAMETPGTGSGQRRRRRARGRSLADPLTPIPGVDNLLLANAIAGLRLDIERLRLEATARAQEGGSHRPHATIGHGLLATSRRPVLEDQAQVNRPPQDEWGVYDPAQCGMAALMARLETQGFEKSERTPMIPIESGSVAPGDAKPPSLARPGHDTHLAPLSMWARSEAPEDAEPDRRLPLSEPITHLPALIAGLRLPEHVAAVRYASGCRIHRVRVAADALGKPPAGKGDVIILSRKILRSLE